MMQTMLFGLTARYTSLKYWVFWVFTLGFLCFVDNLA